MFKVIDRIKEMDSEELADFLYVKDCRDCILMKNDKFEFCCIKSNIKLNCTEKIAKYLESECDW